MQRLIYVSCSVSRSKVDIGPILEQSRHNNALDGVTGLLWTDCIRFIQVLEGSDDAVTATFARIKADPRHQDIEVVLHTQIDAREFGDWSMAYRRIEDTADEYNARMRRALRNASEHVREVFLDLVPGGERQLT